MSWGFYGRSVEIESLVKILDRGRFFFLKIEGRRRIGKTRLIREALDRRGGHANTVYCKIPDAGVEGLVDEWRASLEASGHSLSGVTGLQGFTRTLKNCLHQGSFVVLDEFQYLSREKLRGVLDALQGVVDDLRAQSSCSGGLLVLGSIATELEDMINDRHSPLFGRVTDQLKVGHWDVETLVELLERHPAEKEAEQNPACRLLSLWNLFEGVPKFYQDAFERGVLGASRDALVGELFLSPNAPLAAEAESWFLRELRGNYAPILRYIAEHEGRAHADIVAHMANLSGSTGGQRKTQVGGYVQGLEEKYEIVESRKPLLSSVAARNRKYYVKDRFLRAFLGAIGPAVKASLLPFEKRQAMASTRLNDLEGPSFERLYRLSVMEAVLKGRGPISLASPSDIGGFWSKNGEVDLLAIDNSSPTLWAISCKRSESKHSTEGVQAAQDRAQEFLGQHPQLGPRKIVMVCASPSFSAQARRRVGSVGGHPLSLEDLCWF